MLARDGKSSDPVYRTTFKLNTPPVTGHSTTYRPESEATSAAKKVQNTIKLFSVRTPTTRFWSHLTARSQSLGRVPGVMTSFPQSLPALGVLSPLEVRTSVTLSDFLCGNKKMHEKDLTSTDGNVLLMSKVMRIR